MKCIRQLEHKCFQRNHRNFIVTIIILAVNAILLAGVAVFMQQILDIASSGTVKDIYHVLLRIAAYIILIVWGWMAERFFRNRFIEKALCQLKEEVFCAIAQKGISAFSRESTGRYLSILTNDMNTIETHYLQNYFSIILNCCYFIAALLLMLWYDRWLTICAIGMVACSLIISILTGGKLPKEEKRVSVQNEKFVGVVKDLLSGFSVMKSFKAEKEIAGLFSQENTILEKNKCHRRKTEAVINLTGNCLGFCVQAGVMLLGAYFAMEGRITVGVLIAFVQLMNYIIQPIQQLPPALANRKAAIGLFHKMAEVIEANAEKEDGEQIDDIGQGILLQKVSFGYNEKQNILKEVSLFFEKDKSYAIIGASGSGKSTLLNLILGGYTTYDGSIIIGNRELKEVSPDSLYDLLSVVQQNVFVFDHTIENNITLFKHFSKEQIDGAICKSGLNELVEKKGKDYCCGENGSGLSGGEKQRLSIARGLLRNSPILLMDEATSALDAVTSAAIETMILQMSHVLRIVVTHKLNPQVLQQYDQIVVMQDGRVEGCGTYEWLMRNCPYFNLLLEKQA